MKKLLLVPTFLILLFSQSMMSQQTGFVGEVKMFAGNFAPRGWALCEGQLIAISSNVALFSILGTTYGGDGRTTFALPDLRGRVPVGVGNGPGLTSIPLGSRYGSETITINQVNLPAHNHSFSLNGVTENGTTNDPTGNYPANTGLFDNEYRSDGTLVPMESGTTSNTGGSQPLNIRQPSAGINFIICIAGSFPYN
jgi:microcystin-dependent protein